MGMKSQLEYKPVFQHPVVNECAGRMIRLYSSACTDHQTVDSLEGHRFCRRIFIRETSLLATRRQHPISSKRFQEQLYLPCAVGNAKIHPGRFFKLIFHG